MDKKRSHRAQAHLDQNLLSAIRHQQVQEVVSALHSGADPNAIYTQMSHTPSALYLAAQTDNRALIDLLWVSGATFNARESTLFQKIATAKSKLPENEVPAYDPSHAFWLARKEARSEGLQRVWELATGAATVSPENLKHDYGVDFDLDTHIEAVSLSGKGTRTNSVEAHSVVPDGRIRGNSFKHQK